MVGKHLVGKSSALKPPKSPRIKPSQCAACGRFVSCKNSMVPLACLNRHGLAAHRLCVKPCWFPLFAQEGGDHRCPGCVKGLHLNHFCRRQQLGLRNAEDAGEKKGGWAGEVIVISDSD